MSIHAANLWKYFHDDEIERFRKLLANAIQNSQHPSKGAGGGAYGIGNVAGSPGGAVSTSPRMVKTRKASGQAGGFGGKGTNQILSRADVNSRDHAGVPLLGRIASSNSESAINFGLALIDHPAIDLYLQDLENGWTALHRALYFGNVTLARAIIEKDSRSPSGLENSTQKLASSVIKVKDFEGNSPFDVYNSTIARQSTPRGRSIVDSDDESEDDDPTIQGGQEELANASINGDEVFAWGSSKNYNLGFGDEDDRQYPEKIILKRPDHLLFRFYREYLESIRETNEPLYTILTNSNPKTISDLPTLIANRPIVIQDVTLSKLHSAIITTDPESNLFICGFGPGGRLGTGDEVTRFSYVCVEGSLLGRRIVQVALGHNHSLAVDSEGEIFSWGQNSNGVLGYSLPRPVLKDEDPICSTPRQIFGPLKRENIIGTAASAIHSVAHTSTSLFTWGRNEGQLGLMDSDSRSLEVQSVPRKVAASLFKSPIRSVAAINRATIVLLENHSVCVFTNYGYNFVKFPPNDVFRNYHLETSVLMTRYDALADDITSITAAGDTIAAYSTQSLFTVNVGMVDAGSATSTTNPSKIKSSLTTPQRIWSLRKGHWDGIKSASVTENGSVIVCTQAGAVWRRVKRTKVKDAFAAAGTFHRKDFKFQRVPGLTNVVAVRSTAFGIYAAIRKDCDITKSQIDIEKQTLCKDIGPMLSLREVESSNAQQDDDIDDAPSALISALSKDAMDPLARAVLTSLDLEADVSHHLLGLDDGYDVEIGTTTSEVRIPAHGFMLGRSSILRKALSTCRHRGQVIIPDILTVSNERTNAGDRVRVTFQGLDFLTLVNLAIYLYTDEVVAIWNFTKHFPRLAFRYRTIRVELMKIAAYLRLTTLESAVRLMTIPKPQMDIEIGLAIQDSTYFEDGDTIIELDGSEVVAHSALLCRRCPFFDGMFNGRSGGQWLAARREEGSSAVRVDLKHVDPEAFQLVLRYLYCDSGAELFDSVSTDDLDEFSDLLMEVMAVANELMIDRLSQICQEVMGRFVNTRNVCHLINAVAPCSVTGFKDSAFEYVCLQLESMLENHLLNDLDEELLLELDIVVQGNQANCLQHVKSGNAERLLLERNPFLADDMAEEQQRRLRDMNFRANLKSDDNRGLSSSAKVTRFGSVDESTSGSPSQEKMQRKQKNTRNEPFSPIIRAKDSTMDLMFDMEDEGLLSSSLRRHSNFRPVADSHKPWETAEPTSPIMASPSSFNPVSPDFEILDSSKPVTPAGTQKTWTAPALSSAKLGLSEIMAQASGNRTSNLSMSLSVQKVREDNIKKENISKISQKERKRQQQKAMQEAIANPQIKVDKADDKPSSPWQVAATGPKTSLKDVLGKSPVPSPLAPATKSLATPIPSRPVRRTASPDTRFSGQQRSTNPGHPSTNSPVPGPSRLPNVPKADLNPIVPHYKSYKDPVTKAEPSLQLSMSDIIGQQRREQELIKEAVAKRSLQEIQEEQAFQEWWDQECRRAQEQEEARSKATASGSSQGGKSGGRGKGGSRGRGGRGRRGGNKARGDSAASTSGRGREGGQGTPSM